MLHFSTIIAFLLFAIAALGAPIEKRTTHSGQGTFFEPGLGNCGWESKAGDSIVALAMGRYGSGGNCGQWVEIHYEGKTKYGKVVDSCEACGQNDLDMSPTLFSELASKSLGRIPISWHFQPMGWSP